MRLSRFWQKPLLPPPGDQACEQAEIDISGLVVSFLYVLFEKSKHVAVIGLIFLVGILTGFFTTSR